MIKNDHFRENDLPVFINLTIYEIVFKKFLLVDITKKLL